MVMGYAGQIEDNESLPESERKKARIIRQQSTKMKNLINDLNLASKLEYNMQPIHPEPVNASSVFHSIGYFSSISKLIKSTTLCLSTTANKVDLPLQFLSLFQRIVILNKC